MSNTNKTILLITLPIIIVGAVWYGSDFWPWPSESRMQERAAAVRGICTNNEDSKECKNIKNKYNMSFGYCITYYDFMNPKNYEIITWPDGTKTNGMPIYSYTPVAWRGKTDKPENSIYLSCKDHK